MPINNTCKKNEADVVIELIMKVMLPLFGKVTVEKNKTKYSGIGISGLEVEHIGMGSADTWHGSPDFRIGCVCVLSGEIEEDDPYDFLPSTTSSSFICHSPISSSPASSVTNFEAKKSIYNADRDQLTAACVVSSFVNHNINQKSMIPAILITAKIFYFPI